MSKTLKEVQRILSSQFSLDLTNVPTETSFEFHLGSDSRDLLEIIAAFEVTFDIEINYKDIIEIKTVQNALDYIEQEIIARDKLYKNIF
ncbi:MAG: acyl carrier protein [Arcobacter sp.]|nr:acyl carrier protein [Arcobacter sp.]